MNKELFKNILNEFIKLEDFTDKLNEAGISIIETPAYNTSGYLFDRLIEAYFTEDGVNWITWYMFEKRPYPDQIHAFDEDDNEVCNNIDELWDIVKDYLK